MCLRSTLCNTFLYCTTYSRTTVKSVNCISLLNSDTLSAHVDVAWYDTQLQVAHYVSTQLSSVSPFSSFVLYGVGVLAAFTPCTIGMLPVTLAYLGRFDSGTTQRDVALNTLFYALGLAIAFSSFGLSAVYFGKLVGSLGGVLPFAGRVFHVVSAALFVALGLALLDLVTIRFPSVNVPAVKMSNTGRVAELVGALILGATSALLEAPCTSPILAALLTFLSNLTSTPTATPSAGAGGDASAYVVGATFMFLFSMGYATPLVALGLLGERVNNQGRRLRSSSGGSSAATSVLALNALAAALIMYGSFQTLASVEQLFAGCRS